MGQKPMNFPGMKQHVKVLPGATPRGPVVPAGVPILGRPAPAMATITFLDVPGQPGKVTINLQMYPKPATLDGCTPAQRAAAETMQGLIAKIQAKQQARAAAELAAAAPGQPGAPVASGPAAAGVGTAAAVYAAMAQDVKNGHISPEVLQAPPPEGKPADAEVFLRDDLLRFARYLMNGTSATDNLLRNKVDCWIRGPQTGGLAAERGTGSGRA